MTDIPMDAGTSRAALPGEAEAMMTDARKALESAREALRLALLWTDEEHDVNFWREGADAALAAIDAALASGEQGWRIPEGYALVPVKVTHAMKNAVRANGGNQAVAYALAAWPDLLAAAPPAPETRS